MADKRDTEELRQEEARRARVQAELAEESATEEERRIHRRRAEKARYLREKLDEQAKSS